MNNKNHRIFFFFLVFSLLVNGGNAFAKKSKDREYWVKTMIKIIDPLYTNLSQNTLRKNMPVETFDGLNNGNKECDAFGSFRTFI